MAFQLAPHDTTTAAALLRARFTPTDIRDFYHLATPNLQPGLWSGVRRQSGSTFDSFEILLSAVDYPALTVERDCSGIYRPWWHPEEQEKQQLHSSLALACLTLIDRLTRSSEHAPKYKPDDLALTLSSARIGGQCDGALTCQRRGLSITLSRVPKRSARVRQYHNPM